MSKNLINPEVHFSDYTDLAAYLKDICDTDKWEIIPLGSVEMGYTKGEKQTFVDTDMELNRQLNQNGTLYLSRIKDPEYKMPLNKSSLFTLKDRSGISCGYGSSLIDNGDFTKYIELFNPAASYYGNKSIKILRRKGQILAAHGPNYAVIRQDEIFSALDNNMQHRFPGCKMTRATYTVSRTIAVYDIADSTNTIMSAYADACERCMGISELQIEDSRASLSLSTSDVGETSVEIEPLLSFGGPMYPLGPKIKVKHNAGNDISIVENRLNEAYALVGEGLNTVAEMIDTPIANPVPVLIAAANEVGISKIARKATKVVIEEYKASIGSEQQTAFDIYQSLMSIKYKDQYEALTDATKLKIEESFYRLLKLKWKKMDVPGPMDL